MTNALARIMNEHFAAIEAAQNDEDDYENDEWVYHCLRDWGCSSEEIDRLCKIENREECNRIMREGL